MALIPYDFTAPIRTERLVLRPMTLADVDAVHSYQSLTEVAEYQLFEPRSREAVLEKITGFASALRLESDGDYLQVAVEKSGRLIGDVYFAIRSVDSLCGEIGWTFHPDAQGRGLGKALMVELLERATADGHHVMLALIEAENTASIALHTKLGFEQVGLLPEVGTKFGRWLDLAILRRTLA